METNATPASAVLGALAQINPLIGAAAGLIATVKTIRDSVKAAVPDAENVPSDAELIQRLLTESKLLQSDVATARQWAEELIAKGGGA